MPLIADLKAAVLSGTAQVLLTVNVGGARVQDVLVRNASGVNAITNAKAFERPYSGGARAQLGATLASLAPSGGSDKIVVAQPVEILEIEGTQGAGGNTVDVSVTSGVLGDSG